MWKIFLVEDESVIREGFRDKIPWEQYGFQLVGEAGDGEMALPMIRKIRPDVLITDIKMPFMDGLSLSAIVNEEFPKMTVSYTHLSARVRDSGDILEVTVKLKGIGGDFPIPTLAEWTGSGYGHARWGLSLIHI